MTNEIKKLGGTSYKNSKSKKKTELKKAAQKKQVIAKDRQIKIKIKHLEKELTRISKTIADGKADKKVLVEKDVIEKKISQLNILNEKFIKNKN